MNKIKTIIVTSASALLLAGSAVVATATSVNQNASALDETVSSGNTVVCYYESRAKAGATYYDCGTCKKEFNARGVGKTGTCTVSSGSVVIVIDPGVKPRIQ